MGEWWVQHPLSLPSPSPPVSSYMLSEALVLNATILVSWKTELVLNKKLTLSSVGDVVDKLKNIKPIYSTEIAWQTISKCGRLPANANRRVVIFLRTQSSGN